MQSVLSFVWFRHTSSTLSYTYEAQFFVSKFYAVYNVAVVVVDAVIA